jgi:hypothetical protein
MIPGQTLPKRGKIARVTDDVRDYRDLQRLLTTNAIRRQTMRGWVLKNRKMERSRRRSRALRFPATSFAIAMADEHRPGSRRIILSGEKGCDTRHFVAFCGMLNIASNVTQNTA